MLPSCSLRNLSHPKEVRCILGAVGRLLGRRGLCPRYGRSKWSSVWRPGDGTGIRRGDLAFNYFPDKMVRFLVA